MNHEEQTKFIAMLVEKVTKGVRKQLKGYVNQTVETIEYHRMKIQSLLKDYELLYERLRLVRADFEAFESMIKEGVELKKHKYEINRMIQDMNDKMMDLKFFKAEINNELKILKRQKND